MLQRFNRDYFKKYKKKNLLGLETGARSYLYGFWLRRFNRWIGRYGRILEVGCGFGYFLDFLTRRFKNTTGCDISGEASAEARRKSGADVVLCSAEELSFLSRFDLVVAFDVIEHLQHPESFLREAHRVLHRRGYLVLSTPNPESFGAAIKKEDWFGWSDATHIHILKKAEWIKRFRDAGFIVVDGGSDLLWDVPYIKGCPLILQKILFLAPYWILTRLFGYFHWTSGENLIFILRKSNKPHGFG